MLVVRRISDSRRPCWRQAVGRQVHSEHAGKTVTNAMQQAANINHPTRDDWKTPPVGDVAVTGPLHTARALRALETRFRLAIQASGTVVFEQDKSLRYSRVDNPHAPFTPARVLGRGDEDLFPPEDADRMTELKRRVLDSGVGGCLDIGTTLAGAPRYFHLSVEPLFDEDGAIVGVASVLMDIAARKAAEATLREATRSRAETERAAVSDERNRIARDLHDSVTQALFTISLISEALPDVWHSHRTEALQSLEQLRILAQGALAEMRTLLWELRPGEMEEHNLGERLRQLPNRTSANSRLLVTTTVVGDYPLPKGVQVALFRIAQEALNNVEKHARASRASIHLEYRPNKAVMLRVSDNGRGFDPKRDRAHQLGLDIMCERAREIGAVLTIESQPGQGTQVVAMWQAPPRGLSHGE